MRTKRILLAVLCLLFNYYLLAGNDDQTPITGQKSDGQVKKQESQSSEALQQKKAQKKRKVDRQKPPEDETDTLAKQKPLDLSIPFSEVERKMRLAGPSPKKPPRKTNLFAAEKERQTVQVNGRLLMSPEPEVEKQKSADGAGIVINLKP